MAGRTCPASRHLPCISTANCGLFRGLFGAPHALRQRGDQIGHRNDGSRRSPGHRHRGCRASASTSAVPTTAPSAFSAMARAASGVRMPKPTQTGSLVCRLMRATASPTALASALALPVMPVIET